MDLHVGLLWCGSKDAAHGEPLNIACKQRQGHTLALPKSFTLKQNLNVKMVEGQEDKQGKGLQNKENGMS